MVMVGIEPSSSSRLKDNSELFVRPSFSLSCAFARESDLGWILNGRFGDLSCFRFSLNKTYTYIKYSPTHSCGAILNKDGAKLLGLLGDCGLDDAHNDISEFLE